MKRICKLFSLITLSFSLYCQTTNSISQFGITWTFDTDYQYGQFANGDYWVVGPVTIIDINPPSESDTGRTMNGSMINPSPTNGMLQGYDSDTYGKYGPYYAESLNVARPNGTDLSQINPLIVNPNSSLVSTISNEISGVLPQIKTAAILTVLESTPSEGSFRPAYTNVSKEILFNQNQLDYSLLAKLVPIPGTPDIKDIERYFERPWLDHVGEWIGDYVHPEENMPDYGREMCSQIGDAALMLNINFSQEEKETLLIRFLQFGIDCYGVLEDGGDHNWAPNGGHNAGRKWPIIFAGIMFDNEEMKNIGPGDGTGRAYFQEDAQTHYVTIDDVNLVLAPDPRDSLIINYEIDDIGLPEWGIRHATHPESNNKYWATIYRRCCTANSWVGIVLTAHIMNAKLLWQHDAFFDYQDRYMTIEEKGTWTRSVSDFAEEMWDTYRTEFGGVWTEVNYNREKPLIFELYQNYPNPFNPSTKIKYSLPVTLLPLSADRQGVTVSLKIFDILGREVTTLVNEHKPAGTYTVEWNGTNSAGQQVGGGVYFYQLRIGNGVIDTKRMILLK